MVQTLLSARADINAKQDSVSWTALHYAAKRGRYEVVQALLSAGADINAKDYSGETLLDLARRKSHLEVEALLRQHGAE